MDSCRAANRLVRNNFLARSGLDNFMGWPVQDSVVIVESGRKGYEGVARRMNHPVQLKTLQGVLFNWYPPNCLSTISYVNCSETARGYKGILY